MVNRSAMSGIFISLSAIRFISRGIRVLLVYNWIVLIHLQVSLGMRWEIGLNFWIGISAAISSVVGASYLYFFPENVSPLLKNITVLILFSLSSPPSYLP